MTDSTAVQDFLRHYSAAIRAGSGALFVGAGVSRGAGYPDWNTLLTPLAAKAGVPASISDSPLIADYIEHELGEDDFRSGLLEALDIRGAMPTRTHELIHRLPVRNIWTTNYDTLLEDSTRDRFLILNDSSYASAPKVIRSKRIIKLHGSLYFDENHLLDWRVRPVITRAHYEAYAEQHPLLWTDLTATFLTSTFLFLGFSFDDPNVEVLLRLSRGLSRQIRRSPHYAVIRRAGGTSAELRVAELRTRDLERSGIQVVLIDDFSEIDTLLEQLVRRLSPPNLFVAGGDLSQEEAAACRTLGYSMAQMSSRWNLVSLGSKPSIEIAVGMKTAMKEQSAYDAERAKFYYREAPSENLARHAHTPVPTERVGTVIYTEQPREIMRRDVLRRSRAMLLVGGHGDTVLDEIRRARAEGLLIIPLGQRAIELVKQVPRSGVFLNKLAMGVPHFPEVDVSELGQRVINAIR